MTKNIISTKVKVKLPLVSFPLKVLEDRILKLQQDELLATTQIKDIALTRSSLRGGIIELKRVIKEYQAKE